MKLLKILFVILAVSLLVVACVPDRDRDRLTAKQKQQIKDTIEETVEEKLAEEEAMEEEAMEEEAMEEEAMEEEAMEEKVDSVTVEDQEVADGTVTISSAIASGPSWLVVHNDIDGVSGDVIGWTAVSEGDNADVVVEIDEELATDTLHAMLHIDEGEIGVYEFPGADEPTTDGDEEVVVVSFEVTGLAMEETMNETEDNSTT